MVAAGMPSASIATPSLVNVPMTRLVKKPRLSLTTIGVLRSRRTTPRARPSVVSSVRSPRITSTSGILSTGEKKCSPTNSSGRLTPSASSVMGSVEVLEAMSASGATCSISAYTLCLSAGSSKTASMARSTPARSARSPVAWMRPRISSRFSGVDRPRATALSSRPAEYALPRAAPSAVTSLSTTRIPARAQTYAMAAPIMPAPTTATLRTGSWSPPAVRDRAVWRSKKSALIMFLATWPVASSVKYRPSMTNAVSRSTWAPSTAAARMLRGAG